MIGPGAQPVYGLGGKDDETVGLGESFRGAAYGAGHRMWSSGSHGTLLHRGRTDGGWSRAAVPEAQQLDLRDIDVRLDGEVFAMAAGPGDASALFFSESLGQHWKRVLANPDAEGFFDSIAFDPAGHGVLVGDPIDGVFTLGRRSRSVRELE